MVGRDIDITENDLLLMSKLVYINPGWELELSQTISIKELAKQAIDELKGKMDEKEYALLEEIYNNKKYNDWTIVEKGYTNQNSTNGLVAMAISTGDGNGIVVYRGTEGMFVAGEGQVDMNDNVEFVRECDTEQQKAALKFLKEQQSKFDSIIITGHSKGGNDALYAGVMAPELAHKIKSIETFNAPGFNEDFVNRLERDKGLELFKGKITEYQTSNDIVSSILINIGNIVICKSKTKDSDIPNSHLLSAFEVSDDSVMEMSFESSSAKSIPSLLTNKLTLMLQKVPEPYLSRMVDAVIYTNTAALDNKGIVTRTQKTFNSMKSALEEFHLNNKNSDLILNNLISITGFQTVFNMVTSPRHWEMIGTVITVGIGALLAINFIIIMGDIIGEMLIDALGNAIDNLVDIAVDALNKFINTVKEKITEFANWIFEKAVETGKYLESKLMEAKEAVKNAIVSFCDTLRSNIKKAYEGFVFGSKVLYSSVKAAIKAMNAATYSKILAMLNDIETLAYKANRLREVYNSNMSILNETINLVGGVQSKYHESYVRSACSSVLSEAQAAKRLLASVEKELYKKKNMLIEAVNIMREVDYNAVRYITSHIPMLI